MNWKKIKEECPKAFKLLYDKFADGYQVDKVILDDNLTIGICWYDAKFDDIDYESITYNTRDLFDFFDDNGVPIEIFVESTDVNEKAQIYVDKWNYNIFTRIPVIKGAECVGTRSQAEEAAFEHAFKILEEMI